MDSDSLEKLKYPVGKFSMPENVDNNTIDQWIQDLEELPQKLREALKGLNEEQLNTPYRPGGWTVRQVVHHIGDSHLNSYIRFKLALTEDNPAIKPYDQDKAAELEEYNLLPVEDSLDFVEVLHKRWIVLLKTLKDSDWEKTFFHPETKKNISLKRNLGIYAWHSKHHVAHITSLRQRNSW